MSLIVRILSRIKVSPSGCWEWQGKRHEKGYGEIRIGVREYRVHRLVYEISTGVKPGDLLVCHHCDNPCCAYPEHLFLGTPADNTRDMVAKGRGPKSSPVPDEVAASILCDFEQWKKVHSIEVIAKRHGVSTLTVRRIGYGNRTGVPSGCSD